MGHGQGGNKGGSRRAAAPPRRSAPAANAGPTITEKIAARKAAGGAESWDDFKAKLKEKQLAQHQTDNYDAVLAAQHREVLDREREARLAAVRGVAAAPKQSSDKERKSEKERRKKEKHKGKKHRKERHKEKQHKAEKHSGSKRERPDDASDDSSDDEATTKPSGVLATGSSDESDGSAADADATRGAGTATATGGGKADGAKATAATASTSASTAAAASATAATAAAAAPAAPTASAAPPESRWDQSLHKVEAQLRRAALAAMQLSFDVRRDGAASFGLGCEPRSGLLVVREVERGSAAEAAGLRTGHTIVKLRDLHRKLPADAPGTEVVMSSASMRACVELIRLSQFCRFVVRQEEGG